jgi:cytochrome P450
MSRVDLSAADPLELPTTRDRLLDPAPELGPLRERHPVARLRYPDGHLGWLVTGYELSRALLVDPRFTVRINRLPAGDPVALAEWDRAEKSLPESAGVLIALDPPQHSRIRHALAGYFTVRSVAERTPEIEGIVAERLDAVERAQRPVDLVSTFALPISSFTICDVLGVPHEDRERFEHPSVVLADPEASGEEKVAAVKDFFTYCRQVVQEKRAKPARDVLSDLVVKGELTEDEIVGVALQLFQAGHETTASMVALGIFTLLWDRSRWEALLADPALVGAAVEELLRYLSIVQMGTFARTALEDVELGDALIKAGQSVTVMLPVANRDPRKFPDPDAVQLARHATGHLAFGYGRHMCIGQHLARLELKLALEGLVRRFPTLALAVPPQDISFFSGEHQLYGVDALPVVW